MARYYQSNVSNPSGKVTPNQARFIQKMGGYVPEEDIMSYPAVPFLTNEEDAGFPIGNTGEFRADPLNSYDYFPQYLGPIPLYKNGVLGYVSDRMTDAYRGMNNAMNGLSRRFGTPRASADESLSAPVDYMNRIMR